MRLNLFLWFDERPRPKTVFLEKVSAVMEEHFVHTTLVDIAAQGQMIFTSAYLSPPNKGRAETRGMPANVSRGETLPHALVVDDAPDVLEMLAILLRHEGYEVITAVSAVEALKAAEAERFDIVVSDIGMPGMDGYSLAAALRAMPSYTNVPLVAVTGFAMYDDRERAVNSGFNAHLTKPINPMTLIELLARLREQG